jgi:hypothetical protein
MVILEIVVRGTVTSPPAPPPVLVLVSESDTETARFPERQPERMASPFM